MQGVGFRAFVERTATARGITGWVRNRRTGAVEMVLAGSVEDVAAALNACRTGPPHASVADLYLIEDVDDASLGTFATFEVQSTV